MDEFSGGGECRKTCAREWGGEELPELRQGGMSSPARGNDGKQARGSGEPLDEAAGWTVTMAEGEV